MKLQKQSILQIFENTSDSMSTKQIRGALGLKKPATAKLKLELKKLIKERKIKKQGTRYFLNINLKNNNFSMGKIKEKLNKKSINKGFSKTKINKFSNKTETGYFTRNRKGFGFVNIGSDRSDIFISANEQAYAMEGDLVKAQIYPHRGFRGKRKGKIVRIIQRASKEIIAQIKITDKEILAIPIKANSGVPFLRIDMKKEDKKEFNKLVSGTFVKVELLEDNNTNLFTNRPSGKILSILNKLSSNDLGIQLIINENLIRSKYPKDINNYLKKFSKQVRFDSNCARKDLRDLYFVTIDGKNASDFDDAVFVTENKKSNGLFKLFVSIADVSHYVRPGDPIDKEAFLRGTSVYLSKYAIHMLPEELSKNLCSLRPKVNRLTLTCEMTINSEGGIEDYSIFESIIRSRARLNYEDVSDFLDGKPSSISNPIVKSNLKKMYKLAKILERKRLERGALQFSFSEEIFEFDKNLLLTGIKLSYQSTGMKIIEQFMLEANETVAKHCVKNKIPSIYRVHDSPDTKKVKKLKKIFLRFGFKTPIKSLTESKKFNEIIENIKTLKNSEQLQVLLLRSMSLAIYETKNKGHFGLAAKYYTHFTSPIRRYPDLLVHRALKNKIFSDQNAIGKEKINFFINDKIAEFCSQQERRAEKAERQSIDLIKVDFLAKYIGQTFNIIVKTIETNGFKIQIESICFEWFLPLESVTNDYFIFDENSLTLKSHSKNRFLKVGQLLEIQLLNANIITRNLEFKIEKWLN